MWLTRLWRRLTRRVELTAPLTIGGRPHVLRALGQRDATAARERVRKLAAAVERDIQGKGIALLPLADFWGRLPTSADLPREQGADEGRRA